ncbi:MAG: IS110 family transposase [Bacilli bacterium]|jgi:transposase
MNYVLAIDIAKNKSMVSLISSGGEILIKPYDINHTLIDFKNLKKRIENYDIYHGDLTVFMESTANYHLSVKRFFKEETDYEVHVINPLHSAMHKRNLRKTKTDKQDCYNLADLYFTGKVKNYADHKQYYLNLNDMAREYQFLVENTTSLKNKFKGQVNLTFPEYENLFKGALIYSNTALSLIERYPHADILTSTRVDAISNFMAKLNGRHEGHYKRKAALIKKTAKTSYPAVSKDDEKVNNLIITTKLLRYNIALVDDLKEKLIDKAKQCYLFESINSINGFGELTTALIIAELKDINRFNNIKELTAYCGLDPTIKQSGSSVNGKGHISKTGNKYIRRILFNTICNIIMTSSRNNPDNEILVYYRKKRNEGKHHYVAVIACTTKLLRLILALCKKNTN